MILNTALNIDCLIGMQYIPDKAINLIICDLPYGVTSKNKWDVIIPPENLWKHYERIITDNGAILLFGQGRFTAMMIQSNIKIYRYSLVWDKGLKTGFLNANRMPLRQHEDIMVFYKKQPAYNPQRFIGNPCHGVGKALGTHADSNGNNHNYGNFKIIETKSNLKYPTSILSFPKSHPSLTIHPTEKPIELLRYLVRTYSNENDVVLDNCCGSGNTLIAAMLEKRRFIGMDNGICEKKNSKYFSVSWADVSMNRLSTFV